MKLVLTIFALSALLFGSKADFMNSYDEALKTAQAQNKDIYMLVTSESCKWCREFENVTLNDAQTMQELKKDYILLALTRDVDNIPKKYNASRVPKHFFLTSDGEIIYAFLGYWNPADFASLAGEAKTKK